MDSTNIRNNFDTTIFYRKSCRRGVGREGWALGAAGRGWARLGAVGRGLGTGWAPDSIGIDVFMDFELFLLEASTNHEVLTSTALFFYLQALRPSQKDRASKTVQDAPKISPGDPF